MIDFENHYEMSKTLGQMAFKPWKEGEVQVVGADTHVFPRNEGHEPSVNCWCGPFIDHAEGRENYWIHRRLPR